MAFSTPGGGGSGFYANTQYLAPGILYAASIMTGANSEQSYETFGSLSILRSGTTVFNRAIQLMSGYISEDVGLSWFGFFECLPSDQIILQLQGNLDPIFHVELFRITETRVGVIQEIIKRAASPA